MNFTSAKPAASLLMAVTISLGIVTSRGATQTKPSAVAPVTNSIPGVVEQEVPKSLFVIPSSPKEGRNPFFPQSSQALPAVVRPNTTVDPSMFVLNGITPNGPKRTAMINSRTFELGETGEVKLSNGSRAMIKCEDIRADSVLIIYDGQRRELRMRFGL